MGPPTLVAVAIGLVGGVAACGSDTPGPSEDERAAEQEVVAAVNAFNGPRDAQEFCSALTDAGENYILENAGKKGAESCRDLVGDTKFQRPAQLPKVDPVGVEDDFAVAIVQLG